MMNHVSFCFLPTSKKPPGAARIPIALEFLARARLLAVLFVSGVFCLSSAWAQPDIAVSQEIWTPREWQPKLLRSNRDLNQNFVEDVVEQMNPTDRINLILDLNDCPTPADLQRFAQFGRVAFVGRFITVVCMENVLVQDAMQLGLDERVAMVEFDHVGELMLDVSVPNIRVRSSATYSPNTVQDLYPAITGSGVNIAILDSGVNDSHESFTFPALKFVAGYDGFTDTEGNPVDDNGHGTHVAGIALGTGGPAGTFRGVAPGAGLVDIKVANAGGGVPQMVLLRGMERCILRKTAWNIGVANLSLGFCSLIDNGTHALSQTVNRMVKADIVVVIAIGNTVNCGVGNNFSMVLAPGAADDAITVGASNDQGSVNRGVSTLSTGSLTGPRLTDFDGDPSDEQKPDVAAPGVAISSAQASNPNGYVAFGGTSMAAPHVAGLAALIRQVVPAMTPHSVRKLIRDTAEDKGTTGWDSFWGHGLVNGFAAIDQLMSTPKTDLRFVQNCTSPDPANWLSADVFPVDPSVSEGEPNSIQVNIHNNGPNPAANFQVRLGVYGFSNGQLDYNICTVNVAGPLASGATMSLASPCPWTPSVIGIPPGTVHACLKGQIVTPFDTAYANNCAQHNIDIQQTVSPARFRLRVVNPTGRDILVVISNDLPAQERWTLEMTNGPIHMAAIDCPRTLDVLLTPGPGVQGTQTVNLTMIGFVEETGERLRLGGVTIQGFVPTPNEAPIALPDSYIYQPNRTLQVNAPGVLSNDSDPDTNNLVAVLISPAQRGEVILLANGSFRYTPEAGYAGPDAFVYQASDDRARSLETTVALNPEVRPTLRIAYSNLALKITWPFTADTGFALESTTNLTSTIIWSPVTNQVQIVGDQRVVTITPTSSPIFFRLRK